MRRNPYLAHEALVAPARKWPQLWRLMAGLLLASVLTMAFGAVARNAMKLFMPGATGWNWERADTPGVMVILLASFGFAGLATVMAAHILQERTFRDLVGPIPQAVRQFWKVFRALIILAVVLMILPPWGGDMPALEPNLAFGTWLRFLPFALIALLIQVGAEELLFRGYIQQSLAARFRAPAIWLAVPAVLFGLGHYLPNEAGDNAGIIALWALVFGLLMGDLTARAGTLGPAIAVHMANNVSAILFVSVPDSMSGLSLYTLPYSMADTEAMRPLLAVDFALMFVSWLAARLAIAR